MATKRRNRKRPNPMRDILNRNKKHLNQNLDYDELRSRLFGIYRKYLTNITINAIKYVGMPDTFSSSVMEFCLRYWGFANVIVLNKNEIYVDGQSSISPRINNLFGVFSSDVNAVDKRLIDIVGNKQINPLNRINYKTVKLPVQVTIPNQNSYLFSPDYGETDLIDVHANILSEIKTSMIANIREQKTPFIGLTTDKNLTSKIIFDNLEDGKPFISVDSDLPDDAKIDDIIRLMPTQVPNLSATLQDSWNNDINEFLTMIGVDNTMVDKKERLVAQEATANEAEVSLAMETFLKPRREALDLINNVLGTNFRVEPNYREISRDVENLRNSLGTLNMADTGTGGKTGESNEGNDNNGTGTA